MLQGASTRQIPSGMWTKLGTGVFGVIRGPMRGRHWALLNVVVLNEDLDVPRREDDVQPALGDLDLQIAGLYSRHKQVGLQAGRIEISIVDKEGQVGLEIRHFTAQLLIVRR